jgi:hypothetical protein
LTTSRPPWTFRCLQGHIDAPFVSLTPGTRTGLIRDAAYATLSQGLEPLERRLIELIEEQRRAEEEQASRDQLRVIQRAFREALLGLPAEEYDWFDIRARTFRPAVVGGGAASPKTFELADGALPGAPELPLAESRQREFFEYAGPLFSVTVSPASSIARVGETRELRALPRDRARRRVERLEFAWRLVEGVGELTGVKDQAAVFHALDEPGVNRVEVQVRYLVRLYAKELIMRNFAGMPTEQLLDRMIELSLRTEEHL